VTVNDFPTTLRVIASYKAGEDLAERLATAVNVQRSMSDALNNAATEIERLQNELYARSDEKRGVADTKRATLTDEEREAISEVVDCITESGTALANPTTTRNTLAALLERMK
jgi:hypothetical protein